MTRSTYRTISKTSNVDESLFGHSKRGAKLRATSSQGFDVIETKKSESSSFGGSRGGSLGKPPGSTTSSSNNTSRTKSTTKVLTSSEIARMKQPVSALSHHEIVEIRAERRNAREQERAHGRVRRERMEQVEAQRSEHKESSETEKLNQAEALATRNRAEILMDEQMDDVKNMNQMMLYSKCVTIRDAQLEEKKHIAAEAQEEERRLDLMMELERIKALDEYERRALKRQEELKKGAAVLMKQIEDRAKERTRQEELLDMDRTQMLSEISRMKLEEQEEVAKKREAGAALLADVAAANAAQLERKMLVKQFEKEEEMRIAAYLAERDQREMEAEIEKQRVAKEKELETARMRAQQEKQADTAAELDELRAARVYEERERMYRAKERAAVERQQSINADLHKAREHQKMLKLKALGDQAREERAEFYRVIDAQMQKEREDAEANLVAQTARRDHREELQSQIAFNAERREREKREYQEEGDRLRHALAAERAKLEAIKQRKLDELQHGGIPDKYRTELAKKKIGA
tara:strand:- start:1571 stop:3142 length:1572 start_codon:yes stop_codon:yes gene_type:complete